MRWARLPKTTQRKEIPAGKSKADWQMERRHPSKGKVIPMGPMPVRKLTSLSLLAALSLAIYAAESAIPPLVPIPGIKLGLANIITLVVLKEYAPPEAFCVLSVRILLSGLLFGQAVSLLYSLAGGVLCLLSMSLACRLLDGHYLPLISILGAVFHNLGQILTALLLTAVPGVVAYLPFLILSGIVTGLFTGACARFTLRILRRLPSAPPSAPGEDGAGSARSGSEE